jgi:transcriptional regulator with XRE-family HTH domain
MKSHDPASLTVGQRITALRLALGLKPKQFAERVGIPEQNVNNWAQDKNWPSAPAAIQICQRTGCTTDWIYRGSMAGLPHEIAVRITPDVLRQAARPRG